MLKKKNRLTKKSQFDFVFKKGKTANGRFVFLKSAKNGLDLNRFGLVVSSKTSKKATERNKIKRRLRAIISDLIMAKKIKPGHDFVIVAKPDSANADFTELANETMELLKKSNASLL